ncbi:MAG TPA: MglA protein, partial [Anaeromyxobacteraceae bacterium]
ADGRRSEAAATLAYWNNMLKNLEANGLDPKSLPIVIQKNKMDLPDLRDDDFADLRQVVNPVVVPAVAIRGEGVLETLHALLRLTYHSLDQRLGLAARWKITEQEFLGLVFTHVDMRGVRPPPAGGAPPAGAVR